MNRHALCILANNMDYFKAFADNFEQGPYDVIVCNESRIGDKTAEIKQILPNAIIVDSKDVVKLFAETVTDTEFLHSYTMGMKILVIWYVFKTFNYNKVFFTDEDIFINNIDRIFDYDRSVFYYFALSAGNHAGLKYNNEKYQNMIKEFNRIFDIQINEDNYKEKWVKKHINAGQRLYIRKDIGKDYEMYLKQYIESEFIKYIWDNRKRPTELMMDEWFESMYIMKMGIEDSTLNKNHHVLLEIAKPTKVDFDKFNLKKWDMMHNATSTQKYNWIDALKQYKQIK